MRYDEFWKVEGILFKDVVHNNQISFRNKIKATYLQKENVGDNAMEKPHFWG